ncbi:DUF4232 domain-containing protein [Streptomyces sp. NPDC051658]|uniref:DUF4232 domain-containing protein n=1 Tax=Streptomyces sp. NPDC051658 TaxID=3365667 RepID=UPI0037931D46
MARVRLNPGSGHRAYAGKDSAGKGAGGQGTAAGTGSNENGKVGRCRTDELEITAAGSTIDADTDGAVAVRLKNGGSRDCALSGYAGVDLKTSSARRAATRALAHAECKAPSSPQHAELDRHPMELACQTASTWARRDQAVGSSRGCRSLRPNGCLGPVGGSWPGSRRLTRHLAALPNRPNSSAIRTLRRLAMHRTSRRALSDPDPPDRP